MKTNLIAIVLLAMAASTAAQAQEPAKDDTFPSRLFAGKLDPRKSYACFTRRYDADHLARHPLQKVSSMKLLVRAEQDAEAGSLVYSFALGVALRGRHGRFESGGSCGRVKETDGVAEKLDLGCGVDCDGGGISVELVNGDASAMVRLTDMRVWRSNGSDEDRFFLKGGADDRAFRLDRVSLRDCGPLVSDRDERAAMLRR